MFFLITLQHFTSRTSFFISFLVCFLSVFFLCSYIVIIVYYISLNQSNSSPLLFYTFLTYVYIFFYISLSPYRSENIFVFYMEYYILFLFPLNPLDRTWRCIFLLFPSSLPCTYIRFIHEDPSFSLDNTTYVFPSASTTRDSKYIFYPLYLINLGEHMPHHLLSSHYSNIYTCLTVNLPDPKICEKWVYERKNSNHFEHVSFKSLLKVLIISEQPANLISLKIL